MAGILAYIRRHHVALLALFIALGGTSYAAVKLPKNSVGPRQLKKNAVVSAKVKDRSLLAQDFKLGQLPKGPPGAKGDPGAPGPPGGGSIVTVARGDTQQTGASGQQVDYPLTGGKWTQAAGELDEIMGMASVAPFGGCNGSTAEVRVYLDGLDVGQAGAFFPSGGDKALQGDGPYIGGNLIHLLPPLQPADHTLTAKVDSSCSTGQFTFTKIQVAVVAFK